MKESSVGNLQLYVGKFRFPAHDAAVAAAAAAAAAAAHDDD